MTNLTSHYTQTYFSHIIFLKKVFWICFCVQVFCLNACMSSTCVLSVLEVRGVRALAGVLRLSQPQACYLSPLITTEEGFFFKYFIQIDWDQSF